MASVLWETDDSFDTMFVIWSGAATPWRTYLYADYQYVYISQAPSITRLLYGMGSGVSMEARDVTNVAPIGSHLVPYVLTHHLNDWGDTFYTVALEAPTLVSASGGQVHHSYHPEDINSWETKDQTFGRVVDVEEDEVEAVARVLGSDQVGQRERNAFRRGKSIFAVQDHAVATVEEEDCGAGTLVLGLSNHEVSVLDLDRDRKTLPLDGVQQRPRHIQIEGVAELIRLRGQRRLNPCRELPSIVATEIALS